MKRGLILSGGGSNGAFQAGVICGMADAGIAGFNWVYGNSIGAINGLVCNDPVFLKTLWLEMSSEKLFRPLFTDYELKPKFWKIVRNLGKILRWEIKSLANPSGIDEVIRRATCSDNIAEFYACGTVNLSTGKYETFTNRDKQLRLAVRASASMPPFFPPVLIDGELYADAGIRSILPIDEFLTTYWNVDFDEIIAISCRTEEPRQGGEKLSNVFDFVMRSNQVTQSQIYKDDLLYSDRVRLITPEGIDLPKTTDFSKESISRLFRAGYEIGRNQ